MLPSTSTPPSARHRQGARTSVREPVGGARWSTRAHWRPHIGVRTIRAFGHEEGCEVSGERTFFAVVAVLFGVLLAGCGSPPSGGAGEVQASAQLVRVPDGTADVE